MPSVRVHDKITIIVALPLSVVAGTSAALLNNPVAPVLAIAGHLFSGFMFGPDLDCISKPYYRWGWLRYIWVPYRKMVPRHRSVFSHGPALGTSLRIAYLGIIATGLVLGHFSVAALWSARSDIGLVLQEQDWTTLLKVLWNVGGNAIASWVESLVWVKDGLVANRVSAIALWCGLEVGAMSHSIADWTNSFIKRRRKS